MFRTVLLLMTAALPTIAPSDVHSIVAAFESHYHHARTLKAAFFERYSDGNGGVAAESGTVYFSRPGRMRWEYESPEKKLFLVDGASAWSFVPADHTASRAKMKESSDWRTPLALLAGKANLDSLCRKIEILDSKIADAKPERKALSPADTLLRCLPKGEPQSSEGSDEIVIEINPNSQLVRVLIHSQGNTETELRFENWEENIDIAESQFHFQAPPGVAIVDVDDLANTVR
jgi:outer membrane lipoprotein carrier protein